MKFFSFVVLSILFYTAYGEYNQLEAINTKKCIELCNYCGGTGSYVDNSCECYIESEKDEEGECFDRMKRKARQWNLDLINCKRGLSDRPSRCNYQNSRRIGSYDMCRIAQYFLSGGPSKRIPIVKSKCDPTTTTTTTSPISTEPTLIKTIIENCDEMEDECNPTTERPIEDPCEKYKPTPRPPEYLEPHYDYPKPSFRNYNPNYHISQPLHGSMPPSYSSFHNSLYQGNNQLYSPQYSSFATQQQASLPYDALKTKYMEEMMGRNYYNSMMENQSYRNKMNNFNYNTYSTNGYMNAMFPINSNNYMQSLYASTNNNNNNNNNNYQVDSSYLQSMSMNDLLELQRFLTTQNFMMQPLLQRLQLQSNSQIDSNYLPPNVIVGAGNPSSTDNTRNQENTTPVALTSLGSSNDETVVSSTQGNDNPVVIAEETVRGQVSGDENSDSTERSRRVIRPLYHNGRRIMKRGFRL